jgi:CubicO group peptidase (beta-lactamase class C family)
MRETGHFAEKEITPQRATGYIPGPWPSGLFNAPREDLHFAIGSGSLYSTAADLHRWAVAVQSEKLYKRSSLVYPFGWGRVDNSVRKGLNQTGLMTGFTSSLSLYFEHDLYVVCLSNIEYGEGLRWSEDIAAIALGRPYQIATVRQPATTPLQQPSRFAGRYRDKELTLVLQERAGHLWMGYNDGPTEQYLMPLASGEFANRANAGTLKFLEEKENHFTTLIWTYGTGPGRRFERVQP